MTDIYDAHKYLYHYTNFEGLKGILEKQTLWATHYKGLNDSSEIEHLRPLLEKILFKFVNAIMRKKANEGFKYKWDLEKHGGITKTSREETRKLIDIFYEATFSGAPDIIPVAEPYILSFCAHTDHDDYVKKNGLLSQWRGYGENGGYALVFDTKLLWKCLKAEVETYSYSGFNFGDVVYDDQSGKFETEFGNLFVALEDWVHTLASEKVLQPLFNAATRFKHRGFKEESEVRFSVSPVSEALHLQTIEHTPPDEVTPPVTLKPIRIRAKDDGQVRYIVLNDVPKKKPLPIIRIIIGPRRDQQLVQEVRRLVGNKKIDIVCSETPYLPAR